MQINRGKKQGDALVDRRSLLKYGIGGLATAVLPQGLLGQTAGSPLQIADSLHLISIDGINQLAFTQEDGILLVDSGPANNVDNLSNALDSLQAGQVKTLFNTHWHTDQVGGNEFLAKQGANIIAHQKTHQRLAIEYYIPHEERYQKPMPAGALPTETFHDHGVKHIDGNTIEYGWLTQPHTDGDIYVYFREANVLAVGDAVSPERDPELDWYGGGWLGGRVDSQSQLLAMTDANTQIIPAYGPVMSQADLIAERNMTQEVYNRVLDLVRQGCSAACMLNEGALDGLNRTWNDPDKFLFDAYKGMWAHHYNLAPNIL